MDASKWKSQIARGTLEYCVLLLLSKKTYYGYELLQQLNKYPMLASSESTVYPLLRRLEKENYLKSSWKDIQLGLPPRKYYTLTDHGKQYLSILQSAWDDLLQSIDALIGEGYERQD